MIRDYTSQIDLLEADYRRALERIAYLQTANARLMDDLHQTRCRRDLWKRESRRLWRNSYRAHTVAIRNRDRQLVREARERAAA